MRLLSVFALCLGLLFAGTASAQCHVASICAAPLYAAPIVQQVYAAPIVQLQQVVAPAPIVQQQVQQQVQQVVAPAIPTLSYALVQPVIAQHYVAPIVAQHYSAPFVAAQVVAHHQRALVVQQVRQRAVVQRIVVNRPRNGFLFGDRRANVLQLNIGRGR